MHLALAINHLHAYNCLSCRNFQVLQVTSKAQMRTTENDVIMKVNASFSPLLLVGKHWFPRSNERIVKLLTLEGARTNEIFELLTFGAVEWINCLSFRFPLQAK